MLVRRFLLPVLLLAACLPGIAQIPGSTVTLRVRLWYDNGHKVDQPLRVELVDSFGNYVNGAFADNQGQVDFTVAAGTYRLRVSGPDVEDTTSEAFTLSRNEGQHYENVDVKSKAEPGGGSTTAKAPGGTVAAVDLNVPDKAKKEFDKGNAALQRDDLTAARKAFEKAVLIYPQYASAYNNLGIVAMKTGDRAAALAAFQQAVHINDHYPRAAINLSRLLMADRQFAQAQTLLDGALTTEPLNLDALSLLADLQLQTGHFDQAINTAWKVHSVPHDGYSVVHIVAALAFQNRHMPEEAAAEYATYLKESPNGPEAQRAAAALANLQGKGP